MILAAMSAIGTLRIFPVCTRSISLQMAADFRVYFVQRLEIGFQVKRFSVFGFAGNHGSVVNEIDARPDLASNLEVQFFV